MTRGRKPVALALGVGERAALERLALQGAAARVLAARLDPLAERHHAVFERLARRARIVLALAEPGATNTGVAPAFGVDEATVSGLRQRFARLRLPGLVDASADAAGGRGGETEAAGGRGGETEAAPPAQTAAAEGDLVDALAATLARHGMSGQDFAVLLRAWGDTRPESTVRRQVQAWLAREVAAPPALWGVLRLMEATAGTGVWSPPSHPAKNWPGMKASARRRAMGVEGGTAAG